MNDTKTNKKLSHKISIESIDEEGNVVESHCYETSDDISIVEERPISYKYDVGVEKPIGVKFDKTTLTIKAVTKPAYEEYFSDTVSVKL